VLAGVGIGLERAFFLVQYIGLDNVRKASMSPRDPNRLKMHALAYYEQKE